MEEKPNTAFGSTGGGRNGHYQLRSRAEGRIQGSCLGESHEKQCPASWLVVTGDLRVVAAWQAERAAILYWEVWGGKGVSQKKRN